MSALWEEVQNLKATAKNWEIVTLTKGGSSYPFDSKYSTYNFIVLTGRMYSSDVAEYSRDYNSNSFTTKRQTTYSWAWTKSGNSIVPGGTFKNASDTITVLFYK